MLQLSREKLLERLLRLDEDVDLIFPPGKRFHLVIVGGSALILLEAISRATLDIDALDASAELRGLLEKYDINCRVMTYVNNFPYNYEDRLVPLPIQGRRIDFFTASLEDIVVAKLYSDRDTDRQDVISTDVLAMLDWDKLEHLATDEDEAKASALNDRSYRQFRANYDEYAKRYRPCGS